MPFIQEDMMVPAALDAILVVLKQKRLLTEVLTSADWRAVPGLNGRWVKRWWDERQEAAERLREERRRNADLAYKSEQILKKLTAEEIGILRATMGGDDL